MSYKGYKKTFEGGATLTGVQIAFVDAELLNWLSFQIEPTVAGAPPDITFTVEESNNGIRWVPTLTLKQYTTAGAKNDMLSIQQATSRFYRIVPTIVAGTISSYEVHVVGKG